MNTLNRLNVVKLVEERLVSDLKEEMTRRIVDRLVEDFKKDAEIIVREQAERLSIEGIEGVRSLAFMRDEFEVYLKWDKGE